MSKHTPGPWCLIGEQGTAIWAGDVIVASVTGARTNHRITRANARLIAAAPDLLEALIALANEHDTLHGDCACDGDPDCSACRARAAITKALEPTP